MEVKAEYLAIFSEEASDQLGSGKSASSRWRKTRRTRNS